MPRLRTFDGIGLPVLGIALASALALTGCPPNHPGGGDAGTDAGAPDSGVTRCIPPGPPVAFTGDAGAMPAFVAEARISAPPLTRPMIDGVIASLEPDGGPDVVVVNWTLPDGGDVGAVAAWVNDGKGHFTDGTASKIGGGIVLAFPRDFVALDATGRGRNGDVFIIEDGPTAAGGNNNLLLQGADGRLSDVAPAKLSPYDQAQHHSAATSDVDCDGHPDLFVSSVSGSGPGLLHNDGSGSFAAVSRALPVHVRDLSQRYYAAELCDVNRDGAPDLLLGAGWGYTGSSLVLLNDGFGNFVRSIPLPDSPFAPDRRNTVQLRCIDYDGDGWPDIATSETQDFQTVRIGLFHNQGGTAFTDVTSTAVPQSFTAQGWINHLWVADLNGDGWPDLVASGSCLERLFINRGDGHFAEDTTSIPSSVRCATILPADVDGDGMVDLVPISSGNNTLVLMNRTLHPVPALTAVIPDRAMAGLDPFALSVAGTGFVPGATLEIGGTARATRVVTPTVASAPLEYADLASPGPLSVAIVNPPPGGGRSNVLNAAIEAPTAGRYRMDVRGLYTQFEERGNSSGYYSGDALHRWDDYDSYVGQAVSAEIASQMDEIRATGVNAISFELRAADSYWEPWSFPTCNVPPVLGLQYPQPTATELQNLVRFLDLAHSKGLTVQLRLGNTHMEESPPTNNTTWLTAALQAIKGHPALGLVIFDGATRWVDSNGDGQPDTCGIPAEAPLWMGPADPVGVYVKWAIQLGMSIGIPASKLTAEAIVGTWLTDSGLSTLWPPILTLKEIYDSIGIPEADRTYAISFYEQNRCYNASGVPCVVDASAHAWSEEALVRALAIIGSGNGARVVAPEMGDMTPQQWPTTHALEDLSALFERYHLQGGSFWRWANYTTSEDSDPNQATPIKWRGTAYAYSSVRGELVDLAGYHLGLVPNGSFERDLDGDGIPDLWTPALSDGGSASRFDTSDGGEPPVPARGRYAELLQVPAGSGGAAAIASATIPVQAGVEYTTTLNLAFAWSGEVPDAGPRANVHVTLRFLDAGGAPSAIQPEATFRYFQESSTAGFGTFPVKFTTPSDAAQVRIEVGLEQGAFAGPLSLNVDAVR